MTRLVVQVSAGLEWRSLLALLGNPPLQPAPVGKTAEVDIPAAGEVLDPGEPVESLRVRLLHGGIGKIHSAAAAQYAICTWQPNLLVLMGTCGGLAPDLKELDVIVADRTIVYDMESGMDQATEAMIARFTTELPGLCSRPDLLPFGGRFGTLLTGDRDLTRANADQIRRRFDALAADWESGAVARVCAMNRTPCLILRGVSDLPDSDTAGQFSKYEGNTPLVMERLWRSLTTCLNQGLLDAARALSED